MEGITILKVYDSVINHTLGWSWPGLIVALIVLAFSTLIVVYMISAKDSSVAVLLTIFLVFGIVASASLFATAEPVYEKRQDIYIHGDINMDEFTSRYEIIEQDGLVFTVIEKSTD